MKFGDLLPFRSKKDFQIWDPFENLRQEIDNLFSKRLESTWGNFVPAMDVIDSGNEIKLSLELPGVDEDDVQITLDNDILTISGKKETKHEESDEERHFVERSYGRFSRSLRLPYTAKAKDIEAEIDNGVLTVCIPCDKERQPSGNKISIKKRSKAKVIYRQNTQYKVELRPC